MSFSQELKVMLLANKLASEKIMEVYNSSDFSIQIKEDNSPVTKADLLADAIILKTLKEAFPDYGFLTEESIDDKERLNKEYVFIVDPIDGTKDFINKTDEFTVNIALVKNHKVVAGVIGIPAKNEVYYASLGMGCYREKDEQVEKISVNKDEDNLIQLVSRFHVLDSEIDYFRKHPKIRSLTRYGSAYKACMIASGKAHIYLKNGKGTKEWDVAASNIIVSEAGGYFLLPNGENMEFNRENVYNDQGFLIINNYNKDYFVD